MKIFRPQWLYSTVSTSNRDVHPISAFLTQRNEIIIFDFQKNKVTSYLVSHSKAVDFRYKIMKVVVDSRSNINMFSLGKDKRIIYWRYKVDRWVPKVYDMSRILKE